MLRRHALVIPAAMCPHLANALPSRTLTFPRDHGAHPELRTEWWYITGHVWAGQQAFGFQVTFFRTRVDAAQALASAFAARQLVFAHAALTDVAGRRLLHDQRIARQGFGVAEAATDDTRVVLRDWSLARGVSGYQARVQAGNFALDLQCAPTQPLLLQGSAGLSRKGPQEAQASYYYSQPQLAVSGRLLVGGRPLEVHGRAWMDHEWSEALLHSQAVGWDWVGMNLEDGSALTAFRLRRADGSALWAGGSFRPPGDEAVIFSNRDVVFTAQRQWTSPLSQATYPVRWSIQTPVGPYTVQAVVDAQELDSRASTGAIYWEGLSDLLDEQGELVGRGYLEMTGYAQPLRL